MELSLTPHAPAALQPAESSLATHCVGGWVTPRTDPDCGKTVKSLPSASKAIEDLPAPSLITTPLTLLQILYTTRNRKYDIRMCFDINLLQFWLRILQDETFEEYYVTRNGSKGVQIVR
jgi:hypothetical protein